VTTTAREQRSLIRYAIWMTVLAALLLWAAYLVHEVLLLLYISGLLAIGFSPIVRLIERQRLLHGEQITLEQAVERAPKAAGGSDAFATVFGALRGVLGGIVGFLTILIVTFYLLVDSGGLRQTLLRMFPPAERARVDDVARAITIKVSAWLGGQLFLAGVIGVTSVIGLWLMGIPYFYVLAMISAVGELIPVVGPLLAAVPAIAVAGTVSYQKVVMVVIFFLVQQQFENHVLVPKVMSRQVGVSAVTVIVALLIGAKLLGILGALLAVPTAAILQVLFMEVMEMREKRVP
jgi:predicted PurR-regulated permease PerM